MAAAMQKLTSAFSTQTIDTKIDNLKLIASSPSIEFPASVVAIDLHHDIATHQTLGGIYSARGDSERARQQFKKAVRLDSSAR